MLRQLPLEARTVKAIGSKSLAWDTPTHLLATIIDVLLWANYQRGGGKSPKPQPIPRPGDNPQSEGKRLGTSVPVDDARKILDDWGK